MTGLVLWRNGEGDGTIDGEGEYGFMLTAIDSEFTGDDSMDRFRIKIRDRANDTIIYDNKMGSADDSDDATELGGG